MLHNTKISRKDAETQRGTANAHECKRTEDGSTADDGAAPVERCLACGADWARSPITSKPRLRQSGHNRITRSCFWIKKLVYDDLFRAAEKDFGQMMGFIMGYFQTQIAGAIANYSIADHLAKGPATADEIAEWEEINPQATFRLLRACASLGLVTYEGTRFSATPLLSTLRRDIPGSLHSLAAAWVAPGHWLPWGRLSEALRTNAPQTFPTLGCSIWDYYKQRPEEGAAFTHAMHGFTSGIVKDVVQVLDTSNVKLAADIGGASGTLLYGLMAANPNLHGIVVDLPDTVGNAETAARELGLSNRSTAVPSNFFEHVPAADLYLLKHILHDWSDDEAVSILKRCRESILPGGKIAVIEILLGEMGEPSLGPLMDLNMMIECTGRERTLDEYRRLIEKAGFQFSKVRPIRPPMVVIEATA